VAPPHSMGLVHEHKPLMKPFVSGVDIVSRSLNQGLGAQKLEVGGDRWAGGVAESAADAVRELQVVFQLVFGLVVLSARRLQLFRVVSDDEGADGYVLVEEVVEVRGEVSDDRIVEGWLDLNPVGFQGENLGFTGKAGEPVDDHAA